MRSSMSKSIFVMIFNYFSLNFILAVGVGVTSIALYMRTLAHGVLPWDSGEFQVLAYQF